MATWVAHMRIAEHFMKAHENFNNERFLVGNIGPDCGVPDAEWRSFTPDKNVTHWLDTDGQTINADDFKSRYLTQRDERYPFYLGYYFHLLTDTEWSKLHDRKKTEAAYAPLQTDPGFIWTVKKDWYGQDHLFLQNHPDSIFYTLFSKIDAFPNEYFDFYPENAFIRQVKYITEFYLSAKEDPNRDFPYLSQREMDSFVENTIKLIENANPIP